MKTCMTAAVFLFLQLFFSSYATFELSAEAPQKKGKNMSQKSLLINAARFLLTQWEIRDGNSKEIFHSYSYNTQYKRAKIYRSPRH